VDYGRPIDVAREAQATDRAQRRAAGVGEVAAKVPIGEAEIEKDGGEVRFAGATFNVLFFAGRDAKRLVEFVEGRQAT
jgi:hypothetical protein